MDGMSLTSRIIRIRHRIFRAIFAEEMKELSDALAHVKKVNEKNLMYRQMVQSLFNAATPNALKSIKKRNELRYKDFIHNVKKEMNTEKLEELIGDK